MCGGKGELKEQQDIRGKVHVAERFTAQVDTGAGALPSRSDTSTLVIYSARCKVPFEIAPPNNYAVTFFSLFSPIVSRN